MMVMSLRIPHILNKVFFVHSAITKTHLYNFDPLNPHFYMVKLGFTGVYIIFLISAQNHRLCFEQKYEKYNFYLKTISFWW